jgi:biopolymer transport protein ExbD
MNFRKKTERDAVGFQLAPMIDVVFLLVCFLMTTQIYSQWETEIDITLPTARTGKHLRRLPGEIIINVLQNGDTIVNSRLLDNDALAAMLRRLAGMYPGQPVLLRADAATEYENVMEILDLCRQADIWNISFATSAPE